MELPSQICIVLYIRTIHVGRGQSVGARCVLSPLRVRIVCGFV